MTKLQKLQLEASETRTKIGELLALDELSDEQRGTLAGYTTRMQHIEIETRAAIVSEPPPMETRQAYTDGETRELAGLIERSDMGRIFAGVLEHRNSDGPELELQQHYGLSGNQVPLALLRGVPLETRGVTPAPGDVGTNQAPIVPGVFPQSCGAWLGVDMPTVAVGEAIFPVLETNATVHTPAENGAAAETTGSFTADVLTPKRLQASFYYSREDKARFAGMDESLRENLTMALADALDKEIIAGTNGLLTGSNLTNHNASAVFTFANYKADMAYSRVDGKYASEVTDLRVLLGTAAYAHAATAYRGNNADDSALDVLMARTSGVKVSDHVPDAASSKENGVVRLGMRRDMVAPVWDGVTLIPDEVTKAANGQITITAIMMHAVKILRAAGFYKVQSQHA